MTKNKLLQAVKGLTLAAGMAVGIFALGQTDVLADTLTLTVEKNTIGQGMILEPTQVEFSKGETCADVLLRGLSENGITPLYDTNSSYGFYLRGIANCDSGSLNTPECIKRVLAETSTWTGAVSYTHLEFQSETEPSGSETETGAYEEETSENENKKDNGTMLDIQTMCSYIQKAAEAEEIDLDSEMIADFCLASDTYDSLTEEDVYKRQLRC